MVAVLLLALLVSAYLWTELGVRWLLGRRWRRELDETLARDRERNRRAE